MRALLLLGLLATTAVASADFDLQPMRVAEDTYVIVGKPEDFHRDNAGDIANSAFIVTDEGVVVIDSGASRVYGEALLAVIRTTTDKPVALLVNTHHHPDHWFGNQAFEIPGSALQSTIDSMHAEQAGLADNLYRMVGDAMRGTEPRPASRTIEPGRQVIGGHALEFIALAGHTESDLVVLDHRTGVLFAGDLVFLDRAPTTPHAEIGAWLAALDRIAELKWRVMVPGHGLPHEDLRGVEQTRAWLSWLNQTFTTAASEGADMAELIEAPLPPWAARIPLARAEFTRSVTHLYGKLERAAMAP